MARQQAADAGVLVHQFPHEVNEDGGLGGRGLLEVGAGGVAAFGYLVIEEGLAELFEPGGKSHDAGDFTARPRLVGR